MVEFGENYTPNSHVAAIEMAWDAAVHVNRFDSLPPDERCAASDFAMSALLDQAGVVMGQPKDGDTSKSLWSVEKQESSRFQSPGDNLSQLIGMVDQGEPTEAIRWRLDSMYDQEEEAISMINSVVATVSGLMEKTGSSADTISRMIPVDTYVSCPEESPLLSCVRLVNFIDSVVDSVEDDQDIRNLAVLLSSSAYHYADADPDVARKILEAKILDRRAVKTESGEISAIDAINEGDSGYALLILMEHSNGLREPRPLPKIDEAFREAIVRQMADRNKT